MTRFDFFKEAIVLGIPAAAPEARVHVTIEAARVPPAFWSPLDELRAVRLTGLLGALVKDATATLRTRADLLERDGSFSTDAAGLEMVLAVYMSTLSRDDGREITLAHREILSGEVVAREGAVGTLRKVLRDMLCHEVDELLMVDEARPYDPHAGPGR